MGGGAFGVSNVRVSLHWQIVEGRVPWILPGALSSRWWRSFRHTGRAAVMRRTVVCGSTGLQAPFLVGC